MSSKFLPIAVLAICSQLGGCIAGGIVRSATWDDDPKPFLVVIRDFGQMESNKPPGECTIVWDNTIMQNLEADWHWQDPSNDDRAIDCSSASYQSPPPSAGFIWTRGDTHFDLSMPKKLRSGPLVLTEDMLVPARGGRYLGGIGKLNGVRFGSSAFCQVYVTINSLTVVLNTGPEKDIHVFSGTGTRKCGGPF